MDEYFPEVSVVITTRNRPKFLLQAIQSVKAQTTPPLEIIVVDDCSDSALPQEITNAADASYIKIIRHSVPCGGSAARNTGIRASSGAYIAFLDDDDVWRPEKLELQLQQFNNEQVGAVYCGVVYIDQYSRLINTPIRREYPSGNLHNAFLIEDRTAPTSSYLVRRNVFEVVGYFDEKLPARQDWDMWIRVAESFLINAVGAQLVKMRYHSESRISSNYLNLLYAQEYIRKKYSQARVGLSWHEKINSISSFYRMQGNAYILSNSNQCNAFVHFLIATLLNPFLKVNYIGLLRSILSARMRVKYGRAIYAK